MRTFPLTVLALALVAGATTVSAQPRRGPAAGGDAVRQAAIPPRGSALQSPADALLRARAALELTPEQVTRLEALAATQRRTLAVTPGAQLRLRADLMDAMAGDGNPQAARAALDQISAAQNERIVAQMRARQEARAVLTDAQRSRVDAVRGAAIRAGNRAPGVGAMRGGRQGGVRRGVPQPGAMRPGAMRPGAMRPGAMRPGAMRPGAMRPGAMRPGDMQPDMAGRGPGGRGEF
jgi:Spy/CpxP family protein refolding chaperone